jgi:nucleoside-diphosphate-sugar epimerase
MPERARGVLPARCVVVPGDVCSAESLPDAFEGVDWVFHAAGIPERWTSDTSIFFRTNVIGTRNVIDAARAAQVQRVIYTSSADVFVWRPAQRYSEAQLDTEIKESYCQRSKQHADKLMREAVDAGFPAMFICPVNVYGPTVCDVVGVNALIARLKFESIAIAPPGRLSVVFGPDVAEAHVLAAECAQLGARYILAESELALADLIAHILAAHGRRAEKPEPMPLWIARFAAWFAERRALRTGVPPLLQFGHLQRLQAGAIPDASLAKAELGWRPTPLKEGLQHTVAAKGIDAVSPTTAIRVHTG